MNFLHFVVTAGSRFTWVLKRHGIHPLRNPRGRRSVADGILTPDTSFGVAHDVVLGVELTGFALVLGLARTGISSGQH
jgi:hypothetical protein